MGDLLVAVENEVVATAQAVEALLQKAISDAGCRHTDVLRVKLTVLRNATECQVDVSVPLLASDGSARVLAWTSSPRSSLLCPRVQMFGWGVKRCTHLVYLLGSPADANNITGNILLAAELVGFKCSAMSKEFSEACKRKYCLFARCFLGSAVVILSFIMKCV